MATVATVSSSVPEMGGDKSTLQDGADLGVINNAFTGLPDEPDQVGVVRGGGGV